MIQNQKNDSLSKADSLTLARAAVYVLVEKNALDVRLYEAGEGNSVTDYYVNATGRSSTNVAALADEIAYKIGLNGRDALRVEGRSGNAWILIDYGDVIVNVFDKPSREFYNFDRLLSEDERVDISDVIAEVDKKYKLNDKKED